MWNYERIMIHPVIITRPDLHMARLLLEPYAGAASALTAAMTYLNQRYTMPSGTHKALLTDIGTEMLSQTEMIAGMIMQTVQGASLPELKNAGLSGLFAAHGRSLFPAGSNGTPWSTAYCASSGDPKTDIMFNMALEERLRAGFERLMLLCNDNGYTEPLEFLKQRAIVHYQRFAEALELLKGMNA